MVRVLSSPNRQVWLFAETARLLGSEAESSDSPEVARSKSVAAIVMAVACVEAYLNARARLLLLRDPSYIHREQIERDLKRKTQLGRKLEEWPLLLFGCKAELGAGPGQRFKELLNKRNDLMHFISETQEIDGGTFNVQGLFDTTPIDSIEPLDGWLAASAAEEFVEYLLRLEGLPEDQLSHAIQHWLGTVPPRVA